MIMRLNKRAFPLRQDWAKHCGVFPRTQQGTIKATHQERGPSPVKPDTSQVATISSQGAAPQPPVAVFNDLESYWAALPMAHQWA